MFPTAAAASLPIPDAPPPVPDIPDVPQAPCTYTLCGKITCGPVDAVSGAIEALSGFGAIYSGATGSTLAAGLLGTTFGLCTVVHILYRKYGDVNAIVERLKEVQGRIRQTLQQQTQLVQQWGQTVDGVRKENDRLHAENGALHISIGRLEETVQKYTVEREQLQHTIADLTALRDQWTAKAQELEKTNASLQTRIREFGQHIGHFRDEVVKVERLIPGLDRIDTEIDASVDRLDHRIDEDLDLFGRQIDTLHRHFTQIFASLQKEKEDLARHLEEMERHETNLKEDAALFERERKGFQELHAAYEKVRQELIELREAAAPHAAAMNEQREAMAPLVSGLARERQALSSAASALGPLHSGFSQLQRDLAATMDEEEAQNKKIQEQLKLLGDS